MIPVYHLFLFAISPKDSATSGRLWPKQPTLQNFIIVFREQHFYLNHFWLQLWNSVVIAVAGRCADAVHRHLRGVRHQPAQGAPAGAR